MNETILQQKSAPTARDRKAVVILAIVSTLLIAWGLYEFGVFQLAWILAVLSGAIVAVFLVAAWRKGFRWLVTRGARRFYFWFVIGLVSVVALFYNEEKWRGQRMWAAVQKEAAARGESLELASIIPSEIPDSENFAKAPGVPEVLRIGKKGDEGANREDSIFFHGNDAHWPAASWAEGKFTDMARWRSFLLKEMGTNGFSPTTNAAADVLTLLGRFDKPLAPLRAAAERPGARYPLEYEQGFAGLSHAYRTLTDLRFAAHLLSLRASALLAVNQAEPALEDTLLAVHLAGTLDAEPFASAHHYENLMLLYAMQPVWEGTAMHAWSEPQLRRIQDKLRPFDFWKAAKRVGRGETILMIEMASQLEVYLNGGFSRLRGELSRQEGADAVMVWLFKIVYPSGWLAQDKAWTYRFYSRRIEKVSPENYGKPIRQAWLREIFSITDPLMLVQVFPRMYELSTDTLGWGIYLACVRDQVMTVCDLEIAGLGSPGSGGQTRSAGPAKLPPDPLAGPGQTMIYKRESDGGYKLYSIGLNRVDDGGQFIEIKHRNYPEFDKGDWVWAMPGTGK